MRANTGSLLVVVASLAIFGGVRASAEEGRAPVSQKRVRVLMVVGGGYHDYEREPLLLAEMLERSGRIDVDVTSKLADVTEAHLADYDIAMFNACLEKGLDENQRQALIGMLRKGKGLVAMHCALWCFQDWPEWRRIVGGLVLKHDKFGDYAVKVVDSGHPVTEGVPGMFSITDEAYYLDERSSAIHVIAQTAKTHPGRKDPDPQIWTTRYAGGRVFVTAQGHDHRAQTHPVFLKTLTQGIQWAAGRTPPAVMPSELERDQGFIPLFDGKSLEGWKYDKRYWRIEEGIIIGNSHPDALEKNSFAITEQSYGDFILRFSVRFISGNSGVQFRSQELSDYEVAGYQADVVPLGWGNLHEQDGRRRLIDGWTGKAELAANIKDWNEMEVEARGRRIILKTNGVVTADWTETDQSRPVRGIIALQLHRGEPMEVWFTNIRIKPLNGGEDRNTTQSSR